MNTLVERCCKESPPSCPELLRTVNRPKLSIQRDALTGENTAVDPPQVDLGPVSPIDLLTPPLIKATFATQSGRATNAHALNRCMTFIRVNPWLRNFARNGATSSAMKPE